MTSFVYSFSAPGRPDRDLLGGKGAELARMVQLGLPVPPGFTITTAACRHVLAHGTRPAGMAGDLDRHLALIEEETGRRLGDTERPLLLAVRSGAASSMPGMMDTVLDVGLNDETVEALARSTGDERFAWDCYRRLVEMFGKTVLGVPSGRFTGLLATVVAEQRAATPAGLDPAGLRLVVERGKALCHEVTGRTLPQDPRDQLDLAIDAVFRSWHGERARLYRRRFGIADDLGTAVNIQAMVFGNRRERSGSGVAFTRDPATGEPGDYGEYLPGAQGEDVVSGSRTAVPLARLREIDLPSYRRLRSIMGTLERHYRDLCDVEFTIEDGRLWMLQTRVGKRSPAAAFRVAADLVEEGMITEDEALVRVSGEQLTQLMFPQLDVASAGQPGAAVSVVGARGVVYRNHRRAVASDVIRWLEGEPVESPVVAAVGRLLAHADRARSLGVRANAESGPDVARALRFGAEGVGLCRTEHMFLGDRRTYVERVLTGDDAERAAALRELTVLQRESLGGVLAAAAGRPVTVRLLDAPVHEFLPDSPSSRSGQRSPVSVVTPTWRWRSGQLPYGGIATRTR